MQPPNPSELLERREFAQLLKDLADEFDILILDTPSASDSADALTITMHVGGALVVARKNATKSWRLSSIADRAIQASAGIVGTVLNDF
jgi:receptor protein-tyrosine kinase